MKNIIKALYKKDKKLAIQIAKTLGYSIKRVKSWLRPDQRFRNFVLDTIQQSNEFSRGAINVFLKNKDAFGDKLPPKIASAWKQVEKNQNKLEEILEKMYNKLRLEASVKKDIKAKKFMPHPQHEALYKARDLIEKAIETGNDAIYKFYELEDDYLKGVVSEKDINEVKGLAVRLYTNYYRKLERAIKDMIKKG